MLLGPLQEPLRLRVPRGLGEQVDDELHAVEMGVFAAVAVVIARRHPFAVPAAALLGPPAAHPHHHGLVVVYEVDVLDDGAVIDTDQLLPYAVSAHAAS